MNTTTATRARTHGKKGRLTGMALVSLLVLTVAAGQVTADEKATAKRKIKDYSAFLETEASDSTLSVSFDSSTTLDDYLLVAMKRNPGLRAAYNRWVADLRKSDYAGALPDPMFSYGYFIEHVETRVGPQEQRFSLRQAFPWFGTLGAKEDMAFAASQASSKKFEAARLKLFYQVKAAYYDYYFIGQDLSITQANLELLEFWESVARSKYKVGLKQHPDVIKAQVELGKLEDHLNTLREKLEPAAARLRALLNLPPSFTMPVPSLIETEEVQMNRDSVLAAVTANNPDLEALSHVVAGAEAGVRLANKLALPQFSIGVDYIQTGEAINPDMNESGKDPWIIGAGISLPIWFGKNNARKDEARARRRAAEYNLRDSENHLVAVTEKVLFDYSDALRKVRLYRDGLVPKAEQSLNASYAAYQAGETDFLNVLDAQRQLLDFELTVAREKTKLARKRAELEMLGGTQIIENSQ